MEYFIYDEKFSFFVESQRRNICEEIISGLTDIRISRNMTQQDIANITGIQRSNIARLEACNTTPTVEVLIKYAAALGYKLNITLEAMEDQRDGRNKCTAIDAGYIESGEYRRKFDALTSSDKLNRLIYQKAKEMLYHRSGSEHEDMHWINLEEETILCSKLDETNVKEIRHTKAINKKLQSCKHVMAIHTHPLSMPPSAEDFNFFIEAGYDVGIVLCHDGTIYMYTANNKISIGLMELYIQKEYQKCRDEKEAQCKALDKFVKLGDIYYKEIK